MNGKFTQQLQESLQKAFEIAQENANSEVTEFHLFLAFLQDDQNIVYLVFENLGKKDDFYLKLNEQLNRLPKLYSANTSPNPLISQSLNNLFNQSTQVMKKYGDQYLSCEHFLIASFSASSALSQILKDLNLAEDKILSAVNQIRGSAKISSPNPENIYKALERFTINLTAMAKEKKLDPVIGRDDEIRRVMHILTRRTKNNPVLIGDAGVGKTAIVEGLAERIVQGDAPDSLKNKEILLIDLGQIIAGTKYRGEFEQRLKSLLKEIDKEPERYILFIDELHTLVGAGASEGAIDASNLLKPALARGKLRMIGATTVNEYRRHIEKDRALERRFQPILIQEPSIEDSISILRGLKEKYEAYHGVKITDDAIVAAVKLSARYIPHRFLPDKAIDLIDEATSAIRLEIQSKPQELEKIERALLQKEIEKKALQKEESSKDTKEKIKNLDAEISKLKKAFETLNSKWLKEKKIIDKIKELKQQSEVLKSQAEIAQNQGNLDLVAEIRYGKIPQLEKEIADLQSQLDKIDFKTRLLKEEVTSEDIAQVVSKWTGIPVSKVVEQQKQKLLLMEEILSSRVIGQKKAIKAITDAIVRSRAGVALGKRPIGTFLFVGPTGVGKTESSKALAEFLFGSEKNLIRIDMTEYMEAHSVARLIGSPPGYVGYEEGGQLTESVKRNPYSVILFDEIEKAHRDILNILLQLMDDGRLTDGKGNTVDFTNTVVIMTSNIGAEAILNLTNQSEIEQTVANELIKYFRPEFLNRFDDIIIFERLTLEDIEKIIDIELKKYKNIFDEKNIKISLTKEAKTYLAKIGFDPVYGARPLRRAIEKTIINTLAKLLISGQIKENSSLTVDVKDGLLTIL